MKVFIWENVLTDYTDGMAVAYAETLEEALDLFDDLTVAGLGSPTKVIDCSSDKEPFASRVWGGGVDLTIN